MPEQRRRISPLRVVGLLAVLGALGAFAATQGVRAFDRFTAPPATTWFAPYVDVTLTPTFHFEDPVVSPSRYAVLGFVVADRNEACTPTWGTYYDLDGAGRVLDLDRRIVRLRERGGDVVVSFGGAANRELAVACTSPGALKDAYRRVVDRYGARTVDFDIEGTALRDPASMARRARAVAALQADARAAKRPLNVWLTLPVTPDGLTVEGQAAVTAMLTGGVRLAGVNVMTMDYGGSRPAAMSMRTANQRAVTATAGQLLAAYRATGVVMSPQEAWRRVGATPMIGRNDVEGERTSVADAASLASFAKRVELGRVSMWSANRDDRCGAQADPGMVSNTCSGEDQRILAFTWEFSRLGGSMPDRTPTLATRGGGADASRDDPRMSPYPIWRAAKAYVADDKVVWHGGVYEAKWWTQGSLPDAPVKRLWDSPWRYLGPVLRSDAPPMPKATGRARRWIAEQVYLRGDRVRVGSFVYRARWWTQGDRPLPDPDRPSDVPWELVGRAAAVSAGAARDYPVWRARRAYQPGERVRSGRYAYEARWWTRNFRPQPDPTRPKAVPWRVLGRVRG